MFTDTHLDHKKPQCNYTYTMIAKNIMAEKPDLVIFGGDNITSCENEPRTKQFCKMLEDLGVYWSCCLGNHEGDQGNPKLGEKGLTRIEMLEIFDSYPHCLLDSTPKTTKTGLPVYGNGNNAIHILNTEGEIAETLFFLDTDKLMSAESMEEYKDEIQEFKNMGKADADETEFYAAPNENAQVLQRLVFGERLVSLDLKGIYSKVQYNNRVGFVNKRAVSYMDELSSVQAERLKQVDKERGEKVNSAEPQGSQLDGLYEDRITYSSFGRRDPFVDIKGLVEEGINIDQVELVGIIWESDVPMAILVESKNPSVSYTLKEGDKILNGKVLKITQTDVLFLIQEFGVSRRYSMGLPDKFGGQK